MYTPGRLIGSSNRWHKQERTLTFQNNIQPYKKSSHKVVLLMDLDVSLLVL